MLIDELKAIIPSKYDKFDKLKSGDPYHFESWGKDDAGNEYLYYWFCSKDKLKKNYKRIVISEIENLLRDNVNQKIINRSNFEKHCPITSSAGGCGYVVTARLLEYLGIAKYQGRSGIQLINKNPNINLNSKIIKT